MIYAQIQIRDSRWTFLNLVISPLERWNYSQRSWCFARFPSYCKVHTKTTRWLWVEKLLTSEVRIQMRLASNSHFVDLATQTILFLFSYVLVMLIMRKGCNLLFDSKRYFFVKKCLIRHWTTQRSVPQPWDKVFLFLRVYVFEIMSTAFAGCIWAFEVVVILVKRHFRF